METPLTNANLHLSCFPSLSVPHSPTHQPIKLRDCHSLTDFTELKGLKGRLTNQTFKPPLQKMSPSQSGTATTYTSIPISVSGSDAITRSIKNLNDAVSRRRPWSEFASSISRPDSLSSALTRIQTNANHFRVNYLLLIGSCGVLSLIGSPGWLLVTAAVVGLWLVIYVFREDPLEVWGHHVSNWAVMAGLVIVSVLVAWASGGLGSVALGLGVGLLLCAVHGLLTNTEGLFLNETEAASQGLIGPTSISVQ